MKKFEKLAKIYEDKGFDNALFELMLASLDLVGNTTLYNEDKSGRNKARVIKNIGVLYSIIETFIAGDESVARAVGLLKDTYIEVEHEQDEISVGPTEPGYMYDLDEEEEEEKESKVNGVYNINRIKHLFEE
jgi:hypothetical protein